MNAQPAESVMRRGLERIIKAQATTRSVTAQIGFAVGTSKGPVRNENQDRALVAHIRRGISPRSNFLVGVVCDGMGGMLDGEAAATMAVAAFISTLSASLAFSPVARLNEAVWAANRSVHDTLRGRGGTTLSAVLIDESGRATGVHVGDSRIYSIGWRGSLRQVTRDDTLSGILSERTANEIADSELVQFVGIGEALEPHIHPLDQNDAKSFLITSDGAHCIGAEILAKIVNVAETPAEVVRRMLVTSDAIGGSDNASVVALSPSQLHLDEAMIDGFSMSIWAPGDRATIWIPELSGIREDPQREDRVVSRRKNQKAPKSRTPRTAAPDSEMSDLPGLPRATDPKEERSPAQLNINLVRRENNGDD